MTVLASANEADIASRWYHRFMKAYVQKSPFTKRWITYKDAYIGDYFKNVNLPEYKTNAISNYIFATVETIRPLMVDNDPKFQALPRQPEGMDASGDMQEVFSYEWDREDMNLKLYRELINFLTIGTMIFYVPWDSKEKEVRSIPVSPFNIFPDPLATSIEDAEYIIYPRYMNEVVLKRLFPKKADKLIGGDVKYSEFVNDNSKNATLDNQILVLEIWTMDYENENYDNNDAAVIKNKNSKGRKLIICPELGIVLEDVANPYDDGELPFVMIKDYDLPGQFWGEGEIFQLLSPQKQLNDINNAIIDNAKTTANMPWIIDKNAGIPFGKITGRPGLVLRKNPGTEVRREQPPQMPMYVTNAVDVFKNDIQNISGIYDTLRGDSATGVYTAQGILALQEAGTVRIRLKVKLMEAGLGKLCQKWKSRMTQFWKENRWINITLTDGTYDLKLFTVDKLKFDYYIKLTAGSTTPVNRSAMLDLMIRLAQTPMPDGQNIVDREAVVQYLPEEIKAGTLRRMKGENQNIVALQQQMEEMSQQMQQFFQQDQQDDQQTMSTLEELTKAIEQLNQQIIQLKREHDKIKQEELEKQKADMKYNEGYKDAEKLYQQDAEKQMQAIQQDSGMQNQLPEEMLTGLEDMTDDELVVLMQSNPEIIDLLK